MALELSILIWSTIHMGIFASAATSLTEQGCFMVGERASCPCSAPAVPGVLEWIGTGFVCPNPNSISNNILSLINDQCEFLSRNNKGVCGPYNATLECSPENDTQVLSELVFNVVNFSMNYWNISCMFEQMVIEHYTIRVGVIPGPPTSANQLYEIPAGRAYYYNWDPPSGTVIGGIQGYYLSSADGCGSCIPIGMVNSSITSSRCTGWQALRQVCLFEVRTVTADCGFQSEPINITHVIDNTAPTNIMAEVVCSNSTDSPAVNVEWEYNPPDFGGISTPDVMNFLITIFDESNHNYSQPLPDSDPRSYFFSAMLLAETKLTGVCRKVTVEVATEAGQFSNTSQPFSVERTMTDTSPTLTNRQCIEVSINSQCIESANSFQAQLQYTNHSCNNSELNNTSDKYTLQDSYSVCIPVEANSICYSAQVFRDGNQVGSTERNELILLQCSISTIKAQNDTGFLKLNSNGDELSQGVSVPHNTAIGITCTNGCTLSSNFTVCKNGTFFPPVNSTTNCTCTSEPNYGLIFGITVPGVCILLIIIIIVSILIAHCIKKCKCSSTYIMVRDQQARELRLNELVNQGGEPTTSPGSTDGEPQSTTSPGSADSEPQSTTSPGSADSEPQSTTLPGSADGEPQSTTLPGSADSEPQSTTSPGSEGGEPDVDLKTANNQRSESHIT